MNKKILIIITVLFLGGCEGNPLKYIPYESKNATELKIQSLRDEYNEALQAQENKISQEKDNIIEGKHNQMVAAAGSLYGGLLAISQILEKDRIDLVVENRLLEAQSALGVNPTPEAILTENKRLKEELDTTLTSLDDLKRNHEAKVKENSELVTVTQKYEEQISILNEEKARLESEFNERLNEEQKRLNQLNDKIIAMEQERANDRDAIIAAKKKISWSAGILSALCLAGAIFSPLFKDKLGILSAIFGFVAIGIFYIQGWHIAILVGLVLVLFLGHLLYKYNVSRKTNVALVNHVQDQKDRDPEKFKAEHKDGLIDWTSKYKTKNGKIEKVEDKAVVKHIDDILLESNRK